eukprot:Hpha_TRINITY_DN26581_c0_g1::TRINITY_DN26581_c0_g1_i1::g.112885::m.112885
MEPQSDGAAGSPWQDAQEASPGAVVPLSPRDGEEDALRMPGMPVSVISDEEIVSLTTGFTPDEAAEILLPADNAFWHMLIAHVHASTLAKCPPLCNIRSVDQSVTGIPSDEAGVVVNLKWLRGFQIVWDALFPDVLIVSKDDDTLDISHVPASFWNFCLHAYIGVERDFGLAPVQVPHLLVQVGGCRAKMPVETWNQVCDAWEATHSCTAEECEERLVAIARRPAAALDDPALSPQCASPQTPEPLEPMAALSPRSDAQVAAAVTNIVDSATQTQGTKVGFPGNKAHREADCQTVQTWQWKPTAAESKPNPRSMSPPTCDSVARLESIRDSVAGLPFTNIASSASPPRFDPPSRQPPVHPKQPQVSPPHFNPWHFQTPPPRLLPGPSPPPSP